jgi:hypothetical protein
MARDAGPVTTVSAVPNESSVLLQGAAAGLLGGTLMAVFVVFAAAETGMPAMYPLQVIGATVVGAGFMERAAVAIVTGVALHAVVATGFGVLLAMLFPRGVNITCGAVLGIGYAFLVMGIMASVVVPAANPLFRAEMQPIGGAWVIAHALLGATGGTVLAVVRRAATVASAPANQPHASKGGAPIGAATADVAAASRAD